VFHIVTSIIVGRTPSSYYGQPSPEENKCP